MHNFRKFTIFLEKLEKNEISILKLRKIFTKDFLVKKNPMEIVCKMNQDQNYRDSLIKFSIGGPRSIYKGIPL